MQIDKNQIVEFLRSQGQHEQAQQADAQLPAQVDTEQHASLLSQLGVNPAELLAKLGGSGLGNMFK